MGLFLNVFSFLLFNGSEALLNSFVASLWGFEVSFFVVLFC